MSTRESGSGCVGSMLTSTSPACAISSRRSAAEERRTPRSSRTSAASIDHWSAEGGTPIVVAQGETLVATTPVFVSRLGRRLSARQLRHAFGVWQERAGFERRFNFHALRHTACTNLYRGSRDLRLTQRFARHKSVLTTSIYTHPSDEELLRSVQSLIC